VGLTTVGARKGWNPDPFGLHEFRFFSDDGKPTLLVRDGSQRSYDHPPSERVELYDKTFESTRERIPQPNVVWQVRESPAESSGNCSMYPGERPVVSPPLFTSAEQAIGLVSKPAKVVYVVVVTAMAVSALALAVVHLTAHSTPTRRLASTTATSASATTPSSEAPTTTIPPPAALKPTAPVAASDFISSWAAGNQSAALSVATAPAVATLFAGHYTPGLVIDRGCSVAFAPIVCTYGPPGGAAPTDPIYEIYVSQAPGGWYVSSAKINN
jgi:hypothetical protein